MSSAVIPRYVASLVARYSDICAVFMAPYAILANILKDHGSQSVNTTIGFFHSSLILLIILLVDLAGCPFRWISAHLDSSSKPFSINLSNIPPVSIAITKSMSSSTSLSFSSSTL